MTHISKFWLSGAATSALLVAGSFSAVAQDEPNSDDTVAVMDSVIVTAKQREQNLQDVPLAITVFANDDLVKKNILDARDLALFTPSFNFASGSGRGDPSAVALRGVAPNTSDERFQGVSFFVDGVPLSGQLGGVDISQLERVEIIKGPQSAQFGRATYSGAVNYITTDPKVDTLEGNLRLRIGKNKDSIENNHYLGGRVSFPIIKDKVWGSVNVNQNVQGALAQNLSVGTPVGREETLSWGAVLYAEPTPKWDLKLRVSSDEEDDSESVSHVMHPREFTGATTLVDTDLAGRTILMPSTLPDVVIGLNGGDPRADGGISPANGGAARSRLLISAITGYDFDNGYRLEYKGAYNQQQRNQSATFRARDALVAGTTADPVFAIPVANGDATFTPLSFFQRFEFQEDFENMSHQLLLLSPGDQRLTWQIGGYYFEEDSLNSRRPFSSAANPSGQTRGLESIENIALFGSIAYDLTDQLTLSFEGRYQEEEVIFEACTFCLSATTSDFVEKEQDFLPRLTVDYQLTENNLLYGLFSQGVKSGRISRVAVSGTPTFAYAAPEQLDNFEIGSKNVLLDGRATLNVAAYFAEVTDQQLRSTSFVTVNGAQESVTAAANVGTSEIYGLEIEAAFNVTDNFSLSGGLGISDQEFVGTDPIDGLSSGIIDTFPTSNILSRTASGRVDTVHLDGLQQANIPTTTGNISAQYVHDFSNGMGLIVRGDAAYRGEYYADLANITVVEDAWTANFRTTLQTERADISLFGRNIFNQDRATSVGLGGATSGCVFTEVNTAVFGSAQRCYSASTQRPAEFGIEITADF